MVAVELVDVDGLVRFPPLTLKHAPALVPGMRVAFGESAWEVVSCVAHVAGTRIELRRVRAPRAAPSGCLTVNETLPPLREPHGETHVLQIRSEDWRQAELIDASLRPMAERILAALDARGVYVRSELASSLALPLPKLEQLFSDAQWFEGVGVEGFDALVAGGFAFAVGPMVFYGRAENGMVESLSLEQGSDHRVGDLCRRYQLLLVDWCHGGFIETPQYRSLLRR